MFPSPSEFSLAMKRQHNPQLRTDNYKSVHYQGRPLMDIIQQWRQQLHGQPQAEEQAVQQPPQPQNEPIDLKAQQPPQQQQQQRGGTAESLRQTGGSWHKVHGGRQAQVVRKRAIFLSSAEEEEDDSCEWHLPKKCDCGRSEDGSLSAVSGGAILGWAAAV